MRFQIPGPSKGCRLGSLCSTSQAPDLDCWFIGVDVGIDGGVDGGHNCGDVVCEGGQCHHSGCPLDVGVHDGDGDCDVVCEGDGHHSGRPLYGELAQR